MVSAESAGVAFSCDPASDRRDVISINVNFGLGESVVSGAVEPDQTLLNRFTKAIIQQQVGKKQQRCVVRSNDSSPPPSLVSSLKSYMCY